MFNYSSGCCHFILSWFYQVFVTELPVISSILTQVITPSPDLDWQT